MRISFKIQVSTTWETKIRIRIKVTQLLREHQETALPAPGMPATPTGISAGRGSPRWHPSQESRGSHSKRDGQGPHALPGLTQ